MGKGEGDWYGATGLGRVGEEVILGLLSRASRMILMVDASLETVRIDCERDCALMSRKTLCTECHCNSVSSPASPESILAQQLLTIRP